MNYQDRSDNTSSCGFTFIELLLVMGIVAIIAAATTPFLSRFVLKTNFDSTSEKLVSSLRKAQQYAMDGKDGEVWGVCLSGSVVRLYSGSCGSPVSSEEFDVPGSVSVTNMGDVTFNSRGEPSSAASVSVSSSIESRVIQLNRSGGLSVN